jgi:hypothetical protein
MHVMSRTLFLRGVTLFAVPLAFAFVSPIGCAKGGAEEAAPMPADDDPGAPPPPGTRGTESLYPGVPGEHVSWFSYPVQQPSKSGASWGKALTDIAQHLPSKYGDTYWDSDLITAGHETTHGINSELRNYHNKTGKRANGFYVLDGKGVIIVEPNIRKSAVATYVPASLRGSRYSLYITGQIAWDDTPTYVFDEWVAYTNGGAVGVDLVQKGLWKYGWRDGVNGQLEFVVYAVALGMAVEKGDPTYWASDDGKQFKEFLAWNTKRAMDLYRLGMVMPDFKWDSQDKYYAAMKSSTDAAAWRAFADRLFGAEWAAEVLYGAPHVDPTPDAGPPPTPDAGPPPVVDSGPPPAVDSGPPPAIDTGVVDSGGGGGDGGKGTVDDADGDGIPDEIDLCGGTPAAQPVWRYGDWIGCTTGQHRDGGGGGADADGDGIADVKDRCTKTPSGSRVWKYGEWMGCGGGEYRDR